MWKVYTALLKRQEKLMRSAFYFSRDSNTYKYVDEQGEIL